jgi:hypothetical protein
MKTTVSVQEFERELLSSARADRVPEGARERVAGRLGLLGVAAPHASRGERSPVSAGALTKPALLGGVGVGVLGLVLWGARPSASVSFELASPVAVRDVSALAATSTAPPRAVSAPALVEPPARVPASLESEPTRSPSPGRGVRPKIKTRASAPLTPGDDNTSTSTGEGLLEEVKQLDRARADLAAERASLALAVLDDYQRRFPAGQLALEASVLRASALAANGRSDEARTLARRLLARTDGARYRAELGPIAGYERRAGDIDGER